MDFLSRSLQWLIIGHFLASACKAARVRDKHRAFLSCNKTIRIGIPSKKSALDGTTGGAAVRDFVSSVMKNVSHVVIAVNQVSPGLAHNGTYSQGWLQHFQNGHLDMMVSVLRLDSIALPDQLYVGPVVAPADGALVSKFQGTVVEKQTIVDSFQNIDNTSLAYICIALALIISITLFAGVHKMAPDSTTIWLVVGCCTFQHSSSSVEGSQRLAFLGISTFMFVMVMGYFSGLMSTNQVASYPKKAIDELKTCLTHGSRNMSPTISDSLYLYNFFKMADSKSVLGQVHAKLMAKRAKNIIRSPEEGVADETGQSYAKLFNVGLRLVDDVTDGKRVLLVERCVLESIIPVVCSFNSSMDMTQSKGSYLPGLLALSYSRTIDPLMRRYLDDRLRTLVEAGFQEMLSRAVKISAPQVLQRPLTLSAVRCMTNMKEESRSVEPLALPYLAAMLAFCLGGCLVACLVVVMETICL
ncbi:hypothetical protein HDE_05250 [Halotydeus destructor]|nr:hypothetical protein HDE_05250 [Halotydeus destructor]